MKKPNSISFFSIAIIAANLSQQADMAK